MIKHYIYKITNLVNGKEYIGKRSILEENIYTDSYLGSGKHLKNSIKKYGRENFTKEILFIFDTAEEAYDKERELVDFEYVSRTDTLNLVIGGNGGWSGKDHPYYGKTHTTEARRKMSEAKSGEKNPYYGRKLSDEHIQKMSEAHKGKTHSEETRRKMSEAMSGEKHPMYGKKQSKETRQKMSENRQKCWYVTPLGKFKSQKEVTKAHGKKVYNRCYSADKVSRNGKTWRERGYYILPYQ